MHYVEGKSLDRMIDEGEIGQKQAASIAMRIAEALQHAHDHGILHRDVKPSNILVALPEGFCETGRFRSAKSLQSLASDPEFRALLEAWEGK